MSNNNNINSRDALELKSKVPLIRNLKSNGNVVQNQNGIEEKNAKNKKLPSDNGVEEITPAWEQIDLLPLKDGNVNQKSNEDVEKLATGDVIERKTAWRAWLLLAILALTDFVTFAAITILSPFFPAEAEKKNASPTEYGAIIGIFELIALIVSNVCIKMVSVVSPKLLIVAGIAVLAVSTILFGFINDMPGGVGYVAIALVLRSFQGAGAGVIDVCSYMVATREIPHRVSTAIGILEMAVGLGLTAGPAVGGVMYEYFGYGVPFFALGILTLVLSPINYLIFPSDKGKTESRLKNVFKFLKDWEVLVCIISITSGGSILGFLTGVLEPHLRQFFLTPTEVGLVTITTGAVFALTTPFWGHMCDKKVNSYFLMFGGCVLCSLGYFFLGPFPGLPFNALLWLVIISQVLCGLGAAAQSVCPYILMLRSASRNGLPEDVTTSALVSAIHITSSNLGCFIGPFIGGLFIEFLGFRAGSAIMVFFQILLLIAMTLTWRRYR